MATTMVNEQLKGVHGKHPMGPNNGGAGVNGAMSSIKTKEMREPLETVQNILNQNRNIAYEISLNQRMPTIETLTHNNLLIQHFDGNLKQIVEIYKQMGDNVAKLLPTK